MTVEYRAVGRQPDEAVWHGDGVKQAVLEVANENVGRPHAVKLTVVEGHAAAVLVARKRQSLVTPHLTQVQCGRVFLLHERTH